jgi:ABC-type multidrug transport system ATPase subunit
VLAQVLPLAAVLRGIDVLHASAVALAAGPIAFLGGSGAGKTTLASRIVARGARS